MKFLERIFSVKNEYEHKVITILGIKCKFYSLRNANKILNERCSFLEQKFVSLMKNQKSTENSLKTIVNNTNKKTTEYLIHKLRDDNYKRLLDEYKYTGFSDELLHKFETLARSKHCWNVENNNLWLLYMQVMVENNHIDELESIFKKYLCLHKFKDVEKFPDVADYFIKQGQTNELIDKSSKIYKKLKASEGKFAELIKDKSIAVVGNGPSEISKGRGKEIDSHDIVIRFNKFYTEGYENDYGTKTDVWVNHNSNPDFLDYEQNFNYKMILWAFFSLQFKNEYGVKNLYSVIDKECEGFGIKEVKQIYNNQNFYFDPTTGFLFIIYLLNIRGSFENVDFYGFKFTESENSNQLHYYKDADSFSAHPWHNFDAEAEFLHQFIQVNRAINKKD